MAPIDDAPGRLLAILQPLRQLESNWSVDIAGELASYYEELAGLDSEVDGITGLDFTDAALVVHHSSCTYGKKVEHLMKLTMAALESAKVKRKTKKGGAHKGKGEDEDAILTGHHWSKKVKRIRSLVKDRDAFAVLADADAAPPLLKEALRVDHFPTVGDTVASETAQAATNSAAQGPTDAPTFNTMRSHNHISGAQLLLQQSGLLFDTDLNMYGVGAYAHPADMGKGQVLQQSTSQVPAADQPMDGFGSPVEDHGAAPPEDAGGNLWCGDDGDGNAWGDLPAPTPAGPVDAIDMPADRASDAGAIVADGGHTLRDVPADEGDDVSEGDEDDDLGVWEPLDPHAKTAGSKPYKSCRPKVPRLRTALKQPTWQPYVIPEPQEGVLTRMSWIQHAQVAETQEKPKEPRAKKKRTPVTTMEPGPALDESDPPELHADDEEPAPLPSIDLQAEQGDAAEVAEWDIQGDPDGGAADLGGDAVAYDDVGDDHHLDPVFPEMEDEGAVAALHLAGSQHEVWQAAPSGALAYEELVAQYSQAVAEASAAALVQSSLSKMVSSWKQNISTVMNEQDARPAFDIQKTGKELVARAGLLYKEKASALPFSEVICCRYPYEVARSFSAFLQQVNDGKVLLQRDEQPDQPFYVSVPV